MAERDENGRFVKGNGGGPGRPRKQREERYYEITMTACTFDDWRQIVKRAVAQAKRGDSTARKFLADYLIGPPPQKHEVGGLGGANEVIFRVIYGDDGTSGQATEAA